MTRKQKCFIFTWQIENVSYCLQKKGSIIKSPAFAMDAMRQTKWKIGLYPRGREDGNYISLFLFKEEDNESDRIEIKYELSFIAKDGSNLTTFYPITFDFPLCQGYGFPRFEKREVVFITKGAAFLPQDTLTIRCKIWTSDGEIAKDVWCFARTRIRVEKRSFLWNLKKFSTLKSDEKCTYQIKSIENDTRLMTVNMSSAGSLGRIPEGIVNFELSVQDKSIKFSTVRLFLVDASDNKIECNKEEIWFDDLSKPEQFKFFFTKNNLMEMKSSYLPDDILSLHWEWCFSKGVVSEEIEDVQYECASSGSKFSKHQAISSTKMIPLLYTLNDDLKTLCDENFLCDVKLKTKTSVFNAHKLILCASSSVFKTMLLSDVIEKDNSFVYMEDLRDDTITRMLAYIYTARIEDLTWETASHLYVASDKYGILSLKNICCSYLKDNLSPSNACKALLLSDLHIDSYLKSSVQDYILKNVKEIIKSDGWKLLMDKNSRLAAETLCLQHE